MKRNCSIAGVISMISLPAIMVFTVETIHRGGMARAYMWIKEYDSEFIINYVIAFGLVNVFFVMKKKLYFGLFSFMLLLLSAASYASRIKVAYRSEPLMPWDLSLGKEATNIAEYLSGIPFLQVGGFAFGIIALSLLVIHLVPREEHIKKRYAAVTIICILLLQSVYMDKPFEVKYNHKILEIPWDQVENYGRNGFMLSFMLNSKWLSVEPPEDYGQDKINKIAQEALGRQTVDSNFNPNIIFIMSEAFWDPGVMERVSFSKDPVPYFHYLKENYTSGTLMVPGFGGGTANTEFEALTGLTTQFLPSGAMAYTQYIHDPMESMASILKDQGYSTTAIHTYHGWFYRRNEVYKDLGFDKFISADGFENPEYKGQFISDMEMTDRIIHELKSSEGRDFIFGVTMQNHGPYSKNDNVKFHENIAVQGEISTDSKEILETYANNLSDADRALKTLVQSLQAIDEPTVLVFFGDHLPFLGEDYQVYKEADYIKDGSSIEEYNKLHSVPFIVWDNFSGSRERLTISSNFIGPYVLSMAKKHGGYTMDYVYSLYQQGVRIINRDINRDSLNNEENVNTHGIEGYKLIQYDVLFGKRYTYGDMGA